jgi:RNA polymerase sigma-70 factor (ECF subfamily)
MTATDALLGRMFAWAAPAAEVDWDEVYAEQLPRVYNFFRYRVGNGPVAEDLTSVTFEKAWRGRNRYRRDLGAFGTWLMAIARNVAVDHYRRRRPEAPLEEAVAVAAAGSGPEELAERRSDMERLGGLIAALPERERELIALKYGSELNNREIARLTGLSESNVGTRLHRAVQTLRAGWQTNPQ